MGKTVNPMQTIDFSSQSRSFLEKLRIAAAVALPFGIVAFIVAVFFETLEGGTLFDIVSYSVVASILTATYVAMFFSLKSLRLLFTINIVVVSTYYVLKLVHAIFLDPRNILENLTGNFVWAPTVVVIAFFVSTVRLVSTAVVVFSVLMGTLPIFYWAPRVFVTGEDLPSAQVLLQITLAMYFTAVLVQALAWAGRHYVEVENTAASFQELIHKDKLTSLPNEARFEQQLDEFTAKAQQADFPFAVAIINVDRFDHVNRHYGRDVGNELLVQIGKRLETRFGGNVYRLYADEFVIVGEGIGTEKDIVGFGRKILESFDTPFYLDLFQVEIGLTASAGISRYPHDARSPISLRHRAYQEMERIKKQGKGGFASTSVNHFAEDSFTDEMKLALTRGFSWERFKVRYGLVHDLETNEVVGAEALLWWKSSIGWTPLEDLHLALERSGETVAVERAVLEQLCVDACRASVPNVSFAVSTLHFSQEDLIPYLRGILTRTGLAADRLVLEVDYPTVKSNAPLGQERLRRVGNLGIRLVMRGFGQDFIGSSVISALPLAGVKLSPKLLPTYMLGRDQATFSRTLIASLVEQAHDAGLYVIATGLESDIQVALFRNFGCNYGQGEWWGPPVATMPSGHDRTFLS